MKLLGGFDNRLMDIFDCRVAFATEKLNLSNKHFHLD